MKKILITGGLGNLGSWLTEYFASNGYEVWVLAKNFRKLVTKSKFHLIHCDIADYKDIKDKLSAFTFDLVIHAASVNDGFVPEYAEMALQINALGTRNLLEFYKDRKLAHFLYFSTFQVYGKYGGTITEDTPLTPRNDYGSTHLFAEYYVKQFGYTYNLPHTILRLTNSYGCPKDVQSSKWYLVLNDLARTAFEKKEIVLKSNGLAPRDFIWMGDVCQIVHKLLENPATHEIYNLSGGKTFRMIDIANLVQQAYLHYTGKQIPVKVNTDDKTTYPADLLVDSAKLKSFIPFETRERFLEEATNIFQFLQSKDN